MGDDGGGGGSWTLLTGHGHVLVEIARNPDARIRDIGPAVGLTERTVQAIVADLEAAGYLTRTRVGRRTRYTVDPDSPFRHHAQDGLRVGPLLDQLTALAEPGAPGPQTPRHQRPEDSHAPEAKPVDHDHEAVIVSHPGAPPRRLTTVWPLPEHERQLPAPAARSCSSGPRSC